MTEKTKVDLEAEAEAYQGLVLEYHNIVLLDRDDRISVLEEQMAQEE